MSSIAVALIVASVSLGSALAGLLLHRLVPEHHVADSSRDTVKLVIGLIATMSALVLGLLISTANSFSTSQSAGLQLLAARIVEFDDTLRAYGPDADPGRDMLRATVADSFRRVWGGDRATAAAAVTVAHGEQAVGGMTGWLDTLKPATEAQRRLLSRAYDLAGAMGHQRVLLAMQVADPIPWPFLSILLGWSAVLFFGFGFVARVNASVVAAMAMGAAAVASAVFLILELGQPYSGYIRISPAPLLQAMHVIGR